MYSWNLQLTLVMLAILTASTGNGRTLKILVTLVTLTAKLVKIYR